MLVLKTNFPNSETLCKLLVNQEAIAWCSIFRTLTYIMMNSGICFLSQFPPPMHGLSKAVETLYISRLGKKYRFSKINIADNKSILMSFWLLFTTKADTIYFTIAQTIWGNWRDLLLMRIISLRGKKCIVHLHGGYYRTLMDEVMGPMQKHLNVKALAKIDAAIVLGDSLHWIFETLVPNEKIFTVKNCIDNQFKSVDINLKIETIKKTEKLHILYLSNFIASKGYPELLEVAKLLGVRGMADKFEFHFAGKFFEQKEEDFFLRYVDENNLHNIVTLHGPTYGEDKKKLLNKCQIFALLTTYPNEGQPISIIEAMGNGMAIITTDHAGIPDVATTENGFVCPKNAIDVKAVADYLEQLYVDRTSLAVVCERNYMCVKKDFTEENYIDAMERVFDKVVSG